MGWVLMSDTGRTAHRGCDRDTGGLANDGVGAGVLGVSLRQAQQLAVRSPERDVELDRSNAILVRIHGRPPG